MLAQERRNQLLELVRMRGFASLDELTKALKVSESTVRRDAEYLEDQGSASRIHGGVLYTGGSPKLPHFEARQANCWHEKRAIAGLAVSLVDDGDAILLDGGSTTYEVARLLVGRPVHVVTNSLPVANLFASDQASELLVVGGSVCPRTGVIRGPQANAMLGSLRVRKTILSVAAINDEGFFNNNPLLVETEQAMMQAADEVIVVADSSKFGHRSLTHLCELGGVEYLVVDSGITEEWKTRVLAAGVKLMVAERVMNDE